MAISGNGTATSPYAVHSYYELKEVCNGDNYRQCDTDYIKYIRLDNDINCNDRAYPDDFEWETINMSGFVSEDGSSFLSGYFDINLDGHAIKNVMVKNKNYLFYTEKTGSNYEQGKIHDGQIRNIFGNNSGSFFVRIDIENLSVSANASGTSGYVLNRCTTNKCAVYIEAPRLNDTCIYYDPRLYPVFVNSDFYFKIDDANNKHIFEQDYSISKTQVQSCRFRGEIHGAINGGIRDTSNCVFDITCDEGNSLLVYTETDNDLYNSDKMTCSFTYKVIAATTEEMKNASALTSKGFLVVNKSGG